MVERFDSAPHFGQPTGETIILRLYVWALTALPSTITPFVICPPDDAICKVTDQPSSSPIQAGIDKSTWDAKLPLMAAQALASGSPGNNPRVPTADEIVALYQVVWSGNRA